MTAETRDPRVLARQLANLAPWVTAATINTEADGPCDQCTTGIGRVELLWSHPSKVTTQTARACGPCAVELLRHEIDAGADWADVYVAEWPVDLALVTT